MTSTNKMKVIIKDCSIMSYEQNPDGRSNLRHYNYTREQNTPKNRMNLIRIIKN